MYQEVIMNTPEDIILISEKMIDDIKRNTNKKINDKIYVTLTDHISNLLERISMGIVFDSSLLWNVRALYPEEYGLAKSAVSLLSRHLDLKIPSDEANFIAIHIVNSEMNLDLQETVNITRTIDSVMHLITNEFKGIALIEDSLDYARFVLHLRYLLQRIIQNEALNSHKEDNMLKLLFKEYPKQGELVTKIVSVLSDKYKKEIAGERLFLMIHVIRLTTN
ncbi:hypothetical protein RU86_GL000006 [Lactococcus piscium]|uniref:PRD domain-containing protein n=2 Tax=Pseudolactococcus piscium TaxID=1364 RepID=A0A2A5S5Q0_9LACT|nr:hypothetical protein RU86_GL000006 [Lactococcus piscium]